VTVDEKNPEHVFLSVVIPAYNEEKRLPATLRDIDSKLSHLNFPYEILIVNDGSTDGTVMLAQDAISQVKGLRLIDDGIHRGKGGAVRTGMLAAKGSYRIFTDADNSTSIDQFQNMIPLLESGYEVVIGSRALKESQLAPAEVWYRQIAGKVGNRAIQILVLPGIWDSQCGFKAFTAQAAQDVFSFSTVNGWSFDVEILAIAKQRGYKIKEMPIRWVDSSMSHIRGGDYVGFLWDVVKIAARR